MRPWSVSLRAGRLAVALLNPRTPRMSGRRGHKLEEEPEGSDLDLVAVLENGPGDGPPSHGGSAPEGEVMEQEPVLLQPDAGVLRLHLTLGVLEDDLAASVAADGDGLPTQIEDPVLASTIHKNQPRQDLSPLDHGRSRGREYRRRCRFGRRPGSLGNRLRRPPRASAAAGGR